MPDIRFSLSLRRNLGIGFRVIVGFILILLGLWLRQLDAQSADIVKGACAPGSFPGSCWLTRFALVTLGLGGVWALFTSIGFFFIVVYDFLASFVGRLFSQIIDNATDITIIATKQIQAQRLRPAEIKELFITAIENMRGVREAEGRRFGEFAHHLFIDERETALWRRNYNVNIRIEDPPSAGRLDPARYYIWHETTSYDLVSGQLPAKYRVHLGSIIPVDESDIQAMLDNLSLVVRVGGNDHASFQEHRKQLIHTTISSANGCSAGPFRVKFAEGNLQFEYDDYIPILHEEVTIVLDERSVITRDDQVYIQSLLEPTRGLTLRFDAPPGYVVSNCMASGNAYSKGAFESRPVNVRVAGGHAQVTSGSWVLPGIATVLEWRKRR